MDSVKSVTSVSEFFALLALYVLVSSSIIHVLFLMMQLSVTVNAVCHTYDTLLLEVAKSSVSEYLMESACVTFD